MIIQLEDGRDEQLIQKVEEKLLPLKYKVTRVKTQFGDYLIGTGKKQFDIREIGHLEGIKDIHIVSDDYQLVSSKWKVGNTTINLGDGVKIGCGNFAIMAGPCSIEGEENIMDTINFLKANDIKIMRGGVYKPRSSPYSFRGLGIEGLKFWSRLATEHGIKIITELMFFRWEQEMPKISIYWMNLENKISLS